MKVDIKHLIGNILPLILLLVIALIAAIVRMPTLTASNILDYDPWWYYRHAIEIMNNNMMPPKWDSLSYYPPGRPFDPMLGWEYTMILFYKLAQVISSSITFLTIAKWAPILMVCLGAIPAYLFGKLLTNKWGGLATALFALLAPTFIGVSMGGYCDNDPVVTFYIFLSVYSMFILLKKPTPKNYLFAIFCSVLFAFNWGGGWFILLLLIALLPAILIFRIAESVVHQFSLKFNLREIFSEVKSLIIPVFIIILVTNAITIFTGLGNIYYAIVTALGYINPAQGLLVNISVAELQSINIFSTEGISAVASRVGLLPTLLTFIGLPILAAYKLYKKVKIDFIEIFLFLWAFVTFVMILRGVRFSIEFSTVAAVVAGYIIGNMGKYPRTTLIILTLISITMLYLETAPLLNRFYLWPSLFLSLMSIIVLIKPQQNYNLQLFGMYGVLLVMILVFITTATQVGISSTGMEVSQNWFAALDWLKNNADKNSLISTWWDPGHIIAGYTGLKTMADGAHCGLTDCIPYNHNIRIRDTGRTFSTNNETESVQILSKYMNLSPEQCEQARKAFGDIMPKDACKPVTEMYVIASNDLIGKYYWLSFYGSYDEKTGTGTGRNFIQLQMTNYDQQNGILQYGNGVISIVQRGNNLVPILNLPQQGIRNAIIKDVIFFQSGNQINQVNENSTLDGLVVIDPSFQLITFIDSTIRDSVFTNMFFFNGEGISDFGIAKLTRFELKYSNPEVKIFKVIF